MKINKYSDLKMDEHNYLEWLSMKIIEDIIYMKENDKYYNKYKKILSIDDEKILNIAFKKTREYLWLNYTNKMREYIKILKDIIENNLIKYDKNFNKKNKIKFNDLFKLDINIEIEINNFLKDEYSYLYINLIKEIRKNYFMRIFLEDDGSAISFSLHNYSELEYGPKRANMVRENFKKFNDALKMDIEEIKKEFKSVIYLLKKTDPTEILCFHWHFRNCNPFYELLDVIYNSKKE